jgi:protease-4
MGNPVRKMTDEEKNMLTAMAREYHNSFKQMLLHCRPKVNPNAAFFDGRVMTATAAVTGGLIDGICFLPEAIERARQLAHVGPVHVMMYCRHANPARSIYEVSMNRPAETLAVPMSIPGLDRSKLPLFLYLWDVDPTLVKVPAH